MGHGLVPHSVCNLKVPRAHRVSVSSVSQLTIRLCVEELGNAPRHGWSTLSFPIPCETGVIDSDSVSLSLPPTRTTTHELSMTAFVILETYSL